MNNVSGRQQAFLHTGWYIGADGEIVTQEMCLLQINATIGQSSQMEFRPLWLNGGCSYQEVYN